MHSKEKMRLKSLRINCTIFEKLLRCSLPAFAFLKCFQASWKSWNTCAVTGKRSGTPRALWTFCQNKSDGAFAVCELLEVKDFKHLCIKPQLAGSFNVRLDIRGALWDGSFWTLCWRRSSHALPSARRNSSQLVLALSIVRLLFSLS